MHFQPQRRSIGDCDELLQLEAGVDAIDYDNVFLRDVQLPKPNPHKLCGHAELYLGAAFATHALEPVITAMHETDVYCIGTPITQHGLDADLLVSDARCKKTVSGSATLGQALLPIQIKPRTGLHVSASIARDREEIATEAKVGFDHELDTFLEPELSYSASGNYRNPMTTGVAQLYTNLRIAKLKYGILTSYCHAYAVRLSDDQKGVELSRPVLWDGRGREKS